MNPFTDYEKSFFGRNEKILGMNASIKGWNYLKMKENQIKKRRAKNKAGRKSRRINIIIGNL